MPAPKPISKQMCLAAMNKTKSVKAAARYLNCSYHHLKRYMKLYTDEETGKTLFELHKNQCGKGIPKFLKGSGKEPALLDIIEGRVDASSFSPDKIKYRLINLLTPIISVKNNNGIKKKIPINLPRNLCAHSHQKIILNSFKDIS